MTNQRGEQGRRERSAGFTLIELLVVTAIVGILSAIGVSQIMGARDKARVSRLAADLDALAKASEKLRDDTGFQVLHLEENTCTYSGSANEAYAHDPRMGLLTNPATGPYNYPNWNGPYLTNAQLVNGQQQFLDPWGRPYIYDTDYTMPDGTTVRAFHSGGPNRSGMNIYDSDNVVRVLCSD